MRLKKSDKKQNKSLQKGVELMNQNKPQKENSSQKSIVFLDLDGTLWQNEIIPPSALEALKQAKANGHLIFTNTGRSKDGASDRLEELPIAGEVYSAGTEIWQDGSRIFYQPMPEELVRKIIAKLQELNAGICVEGSVSTFANQKSREHFLEEFGAKANELRYYRAPDISEMKPEDYQSVMKISANGLTDGLLDDFLDENNLTFTLFHTPNNEGIVSGEITQSAWNKGTAFKEIQKRLDEPYRTIAVGDSANDLPMFEKADLSIAMGNGTEKVRQVADYVTDSIDEDGLYSAFRHFHLI